MATEKQRRAIKILQEQPNTPVGTAMRQAGYSRAASLNPKKNLIDTKAFKDYLIAAGIDDALLSNKLREGLDATKVVTSPTEPDKEVADFGVRHKYLETALRVNGHDVGREGAGTVNVNIALVEFLGEKDQNTTSQ